MVVAETNDPDRSIADVAQAHGLNANMVAQWRRQVQKASEVVIAVQPSPSELLPVEVIDVGDDREAVAGQGEPPEATPSPMCEIDIEIGKRRIRIRGVSTDLAERFLLGCLK